MSETRRHAIAEIDRAVIDERGLSAGARAHVETCNECGDYWLAANRLEAGLGAAAATPPAGLNRRIFDAVVADQQRAARTPWRRLAGLATHAPLRFGVLLLLFTAVTFGAGVLAAEAIHRLR